MIKQKIDIEFSKYIRYRDTDENLNGQCCTCGKMINAKGNDCGHFITRENLATRWDERNAHLQCAECNRFKSGKQFEHALHIEKKHGKDVPRLLLMKSKSKMKWEPIEFVAMLAEIRKKRKELEKFKLVKL